MISIQYLQSFYFGYWSIITQPLLFLLLVIISRLSVYMMFYLFWLGLIFWLLLGWNLFYWWLGLFLGWFGFFEGGWSWRRGVSFWWFLVLFVWVIPRIVPLVLVIIKSILLLSRWSVCHLHLPGLEFLIDHTHLLKSKYSWRFSHLFFPPFCTSRYNITIFLRCYISCQSRMCISSPHFLSSHMFL